MPWSGTGIYTRGYASWTADASNNLPISATKFDTEDNDFAAGIQNCLTIDGQNKPNTTLTWAQALALTRGTDSTVFSIARTGGTNNPSLTWSVADSANSVTASLGTGNAALMLTPAAYTFGNATDAPSFTFNGLGLTSVLANASTSYALNVKAPSTTGAVGIGFLSSAGISKGTLGLAQAANQFLTGTAAGDLALLTGVGGNIWLNTSGNSPNCGLTTGGAWQISDVAASPTLFNAGYMDCPQVTTAINRTLLLSDRGKQISLNANNLVITIPANSVTGFPIGTVILISAGSNTGCTVAINTDTMNLVGTATTGTRSLAAFALAAITKIGATNWIISGGGLS